jgi:hypothetical protein
MVDRTPQHGCGDAAPLETVRERQAGAPATVDHQPHA